MSQMSPTLAYTPLFKTRRRRGLAAVPKPQKQGTQAPGLDRRNETKHVGTIWHS